MKTLSTVRRVASYSARAQEGFSLVELLVVIVILGILGSVAAFTLAPHQQSYRADDAAGMVVRLMREANSRSVAQRQVMRLTIDRNANTVTLTDENTAAAGAADDEDIRQDFLPAAAQLSLNQPGSMPPPAAPYSYSPVDFGSNGGVWTVFFQSDGTARNAAGVPLSGTLFFFVPGPGGAPNAPEEVRAVTLFGPISTVRLWKHRDGAFISEGY